MLDRRLAIEKRLSLIHIYPRLSLQRTCHIMQVTHLVPLVGGECDLLLRTTLTAAWICDKGLHLELSLIHI